MKPTKPTRAIARGLEVIDALNERQHTPLRSLSEQTGMSRATLLRILKTLDAAGWVYRYRANGNYRLASEVCRLGERLRTVDRLTETAAPIMDELYKELGCPSDIAICTGREMQILESTRTPHLRMGKRNVLGTHAPMLCSALGRTYLAFCSQKEREEILASLADAPEGLDSVNHGRHWIEGLLADTRARGYGLTEPRCCDPHSSCERDVRSIAVPVGPDGLVRACLSSVWIDDNDASQQTVREWLPGLRAAAREIGYRLGGLGVTDTQ